MDIFKLKKFRKAHKPIPEKDLEDKPVPSPEELARNENGSHLTKSDKSDPVSGTTEGEGDDDDDDDDFITNEVKRRLKELRRNSFMVLIPEESCPEEEEEEEEEETTSSEWRDTTVVENCNAWWDISSMYEKYCERMVFFDRMSAQQLQEAGCAIPNNPSPRSASKKLASTLRSLSFKKREEPQDEIEQLQQRQVDPYQELETAYVAHVCLTWEALHCQYNQLRQKILTQPESPTCYRHAAQQFQQFQVLLQRFNENEPFEQGTRVNIYTRTRNSMPKLLQAPAIQGTEQNRGEEDGLPVLASDLIRIIEESIFTFRIFLKMDKKKPGTVLNLFGGQSQIASPLHQILSFLEKCNWIRSVRKTFGGSFGRKARKKGSSASRGYFGVEMLASFILMDYIYASDRPSTNYSTLITEKEMKLKELHKKKGEKKKSWPSTLEGVELLFALVDVKVIARVLRMVRITKDQLIWCEEKMNKLDIVEGKLRRDGSPLLFPC